MIHHNALSPQVLSLAQFQLTQNLVYGFEVAFEFIIYSVLFFFFIFILVIFINYIHYFLPNIAYITYCFIAQSQVLPLAKFSWLGIQGTSLYILLYCTVSLKSSLTFSLQFASLHHFIALLHKSLAPYSSLVDLIMMW